MSEIHQVSASNGPRLSALGDSAATLAFGEAITSEFQCRVKNFAAALARSAPEGVLEWAPAFASITIWFDPDILPFAALKAFVQTLDDHAAAPAPGAGYALPFCCDADLAPDLAETAAAKGFSPDAYVAAFCALRFEVIMLGFLPGFAYLGGLPQSLSLPRLATPRKTVPARSVAIADGMCAAYPLASPGGWRLIGRTPAPLFDVQNAQNPALLAPGDFVRWRRIDRQEFSRLETRWAEAFDPAELREPA